MNISRKRFLQLGALASASLMIPQFLKAYGSKPGILAGYKQLVVIQLSGGNDWLNTVIPVRSDAYYKARPVIGITKDGALRLTDELSLHSSLSGIKNLYDEGNVSILNSVGYPRPSRSHFESMQIWHTADPDNKKAVSGWLGRGLDQLDNGQIHAIELDDYVSPALTGKETHVVAFRNLNQFHKSAKDPFLASMNHEYEHHDGLVDYMYTSVRETSEAAEYIYQQSRKFTTAQTYPATRLGRDLKLIGSLINAGSDKRVYYANHDGFDTHSGQLNRQKNLLKELDEAMTSFVADLKSADRFSEVLILVFSEFGRRLTENASRGTDHGAAGNLLLLSGGLKQSGLYGQLPDLDDLEDGDIKYQLDFRRVYASVLDNWLGLSSERVLGGKYEKLGVI